MWDAVPVSLFSPFQSIWATYDGEPVLLPVFENAFHFFGSVRIPHDERSVIHSILLGSSPHGGTVRMIGCPSSVLLAVEEVAFHPFASLLIDSNRGAVFPPVSHFVHHAPVGGFDQSVEAGIFSGSVWIGGGELPLVNRLIETFLQFAFSAGRDEKGDDKGSEGGRGSFHDSSLP